MSDLPRLQHVEDLRTFSLDDADETELLQRQTECTFIWCNTGGFPIGAVVNFIFRDGRFWLTATKARPRVAALRADPRASIAISSKGSGIDARRSLTCKGLVTIHEDQETISWFLPQFAAALRPGEPDRQTAFVTLLSSPGRVVLELSPIGRTGYDGAKMWAAVPTAGPGEQPAVT